MNDRSHPNYVVKYDPTPELLDQMSAHAAKRLMDHKEAERRAREWPSGVEQLLMAIVGKVGVLEARVAELEAARG